jgi:hypothetical protein
VFLKKYTAGMTFCQAAEKKKFVCKMLFAAGEADFD